MEHEGRMARDEEFARWYQTHHGRIRALCSRILRDPVAAEDIAQETLLRAWQRHGQMREDDLGAWLSVVARNLCLSALRRDVRLVVTDEIPEHADDLADPAIEVERRETGRNVRRALAKLGARNGRVVGLREGHEIGYNEIGSAFGMTPEGARTIVFRARKVLREHLVAVGEGFSGFLVGIRVRVRDLRTRARMSVYNAETGAMPALQAGLNVALAVGLVLAGGGVSGPPSAGSPPVASVVSPLEEPSVRAEADAVAGRYAASPAHTSMLSPTEARRPRLIPAADLKGTPYNPDDGSIYLHATVGKYFVHFEEERGPSEDGLEPVYTGLDTASTATCVAAPAVCDHLRAGFK